MIVLDTHAWLWWNSDPDKLSTAAMAAIDQRSFHGDPADRLIVATALVHEAELVTKDRLIRSSSFVKSVW